MEKQELVEVVVPLLRNSGKVVRSVLVEMSSLFEMAVIFTLSMRSWFIFCLRMRGWQFLGTSEVSATTVSHKHST